MKRLTAGLVVLLAILSGCAQDPNPRYAARTNTFGQLQIPANYGTKPPLQHHPP